MHQSLVQHGNSALVRVLATAIVALAAVPGLRAMPVGTTFTYQGELRASGTPSEGPHDFQVALYNVANSGAEIATVGIDDAVVTQGLFSLPLDFTGVPFEAGEQYWLELRVRDGAETGAYTALAPRQQLTATPYALNALSVKAGSVGAAEIDANAVQRRIDSACPAGSAVRAIAADGTTTCETDDNSGGDITAVTPGFGLSGGATSGAASVAVDPAVIQRRITGGCPAEQSIRAIAADGTVTCEVDDAPLGIRGYQLVTFTGTYFGGTNGTGTRDGEARCPIGKVAIGGGVDPGCGPAAIYSSFPRNITPTSGWWGHVVKPNGAGCTDNPATMTVYAICATVN